ncbi:MAG: metallophosphoesterase [Desulfurococcaceae archaeon]
MLRRLLHHDEVDLYMVVGTPFLYVKRNYTLVMADLHLGFEEAASRGLSYTARRGQSAYAAVFLPRIQLKRALSLFNTVVDSLNIKRVIVNGDLKHAFDRLLKQEREEVTAFVKHLREKGVEEIVVVRGNHDNFVKPLLRRLDVELVNGISTIVDGKSILFIHGHEVLDAKEHDIIVIGHEHPSLRCFDVYRFPCFIKIPLPGEKTLVVMPATGPYHPGIVVTPNPMDYLSPLIRSLKDLYSMSIIIWFDLGEVSQHSVEYFEATIPTELVKVDRVVIGNREVAVVEFKDYEIAHLLCMV